mgnify:FL=1|tara:strand:+ start:170 stop:529 length:360 start_codon:yes stop_codon:yes gene_type:complete
MSKPTVTIDTEDKLVSIKVYEPPIYILIAKEWRDKVNGNSYWSARCEWIERDISYFFPFQYGYGDQPLWTVMDALNIPHLEYEKFRYIKMENCKKSEVKEFGKGDEDNYIPRLGYYYQD